MRVSLFVWSRRALCIFRTDMHIHIKCNACSAESHRTHYQLVWCNISKEFLCYFHCYGIILIVAVCVCHLSCLPWLKCICECIMIITITVWINFDGILFLLLFYTLLMIHLALVFDACWCDVSETINKKTKIKHQKCAINRSCLWKWCTLFVIWLFHLISKHISQKSKILNLTFVSHEIFPNQFHLSLNCIGSFNIHNAQNIWEIHCFGLLDECILLLWFIVCLFCVLYQRA